MCFFFFKQKTAYEMRISDWSSDVCSSDLAASVATSLRCVSSAAPECGRKEHQQGEDFEPADQHRDDQHPLAERADARDAGDHAVESGAGIVDRAGDRRQRGQRIEAGADHDAGQQRSEEHTSELQSLMRLSYAV